MTSTLERGSIPSLFAIVDPYIRSSDAAKKATGYIEAVITKHDYAVQKAIQAVSSGDKSKMAEAEKDVIRSRIARIDSTTLMTELYAMAVIKDNTAPTNIIQSAEKVRELKKIIAKNAKDAQTVADSAKLLSMYSESKDAKWTMLETFSAVDLYYDAPGKYPPLPRTNVKPCDAKTNKKSAIGEGSARQRKLLKYLVTKGEELLAHMVKTRPTSQMTKDLLRWNRSIEPFSQEAIDANATFASMSPVNGCMLLDMDSFSSIPRMLTRMIHELSHLTAKEQGGHGPLFYKNFRTLLRIATEELGWTVEATCRETCFVFEDDNPDPEKICPKCLWQRSPETCNPKITKCEPKQKGIDRLLQKDPNLSAKAKRFLTTKTRPVKK